MDESAGLLPGAGHHDPFPQQGAAVFEPTKGFPQLYDVSHDDNGRGFEAGNPDHLDNGVKGSLSTRLPGGGAPSNQCNGCIRCFPVFNQLCDDPGQIFHSHEKYQRADPP